MTSFDDLYAEIEAEASAAGSIALRDLKQKIDKYSAASRAGEWNKAVAEYRAMPRRWERLEAGRRSMTNKTDRGWLCPHPGHSAGECGPQCTCTERIRNGTYGVHGHAEEEPRGDLETTHEAELKAARAVIESLLVREREREAELKEVRGLIAKLSADNQQLRVVIRQLQAHVAQAVDDIHRILR